MAEDAALEIRDLNIAAKTNTTPNSLEFNKVDLPKIDDSTIEPLTQLTQANQYSRVGTNVLQRDQEMIGTLLDIHV
jgi:hypothetical protein